MNTKIKHIRRRHMRRGISVLSQVMTFFKMILKITLAVSFLSTSAQAGTLEVDAAASTIGGFGLKVTPGSTCGTDDVVVTGPIVTTDELACDTITTTGTVAIDANVNFTAGQLIRFGPDFSVSSGNTFTANVNPAVASDFAALVDENPNSETSYHARFDINTDALTPSVGEELVILDGMSADDTVQFMVVLTNNAGHLIKLSARNGGSFASIPFQPLSAGFNDIEIEWLAGDIPNSSQIVLSINGVDAPAVTNLDNMTGRIDKVRFGLIDSDLDPIGTTGSFFLDEFASFR